MTSRWDGGLKLLGPEGSENQEEECELAARAGSLPKLSAQA